MQIYLLWPAPPKASFFHVEIGRDGREIAIHRRDMPNGYCLLPPTRSCNKGNACHGCHHFATDRTHLPEIRRQLAETRAAGRASPGPTPDPLYANR